MFEETAFKHAETTRASECEPSRHQAATRATRVDRRSAISFVYLPNLPPRTRGGAFFGLRHERPET
jgi:hypothetical protein